METEKLDLDIFIVGKYKEEEMEKISKNFGIEINVKCYPARLFERNLDKDFLLKEVLKNHIVFVNAEQFIGKVFKNE